MANKSDFDSAMELLASAGSILITSHIRPDGDACGSMAALTAALVSQGKQVHNLLLSHSPDWYEYMFAEKPLVRGDNISDEQIAAGELPEHDLVVLLDVNSKGQLPVFSDYLKKTSKPVLVFDHHVTSDGLGSVEIVDTSASATGIIILDLFRRGGWKLTQSIAEYLFVAIVTDTGWLQFNNTDPRTLRDCATLMEAGVVPSVVYRKLYQNFSPQRFKLMIRMLDSLELHFDQRYAVQTLWEKDFQQTGASLADTENLIDECRRLKTMEAGAFFVELPGGKAKCSLRSRGLIDVREIAQKFGGGGHNQAAGARFDVPVDKAKELVYQEMAQRFKELDSKGK